MEIVAQGSNIIGELGPIMTNMIYTLLVAAAMYNPTPIYELTPILRAATAQEVTRPMPPPANPEVESRLEKGLAILPDKSKFSLPKPEEKRRK